MAINTDVASYIVSFHCRFLLSLVDDFTFSHPLKVHVRYYRIHYRYTFPNHFNARKFGVGVPGMRNQLMVQVLFGLQRASHAHA